MKLQFKHQMFQADAAKAVCDVFSGQPNITPDYLIDRGFSEKKYRQVGLDSEGRDEEESLILPGTKTAKSEYSMRTS